MEEIQKLCHDVKEEISKVVIGQENVIDGILIAMIVGGHVLLEGPPGVGKTLIAKALTRSFSASFHRVQFTPDLMPMDVIGTSIFDFQKQHFVFKPGPIFTDILLADEINRTPPKTQSALLEAMEERQVTIDGQQQVLSPIFTVIATQNPIEYEGTYPLPEAQLDRFLMKLEVSYPSAQEESQVYQRFQNGIISGDDLNMISPVSTIDALIQARSALSKIIIKTELIEYTRQIIESTRRNPFLALGASPRAGIYLILAAKVFAAVKGRDFVTPDDLREMLVPVLHHRVIVRPEAQIDGKSASDILENILKEIKVPR